MNMRWVVCIALVGCVGPNASLRPNEEEEYRIASSMRADVHPYQNGRGEEWVSAALPVGDGCMSLAFLAPQNNAALPEQIDIVATSRDRFPKIDDKLEVVLDGKTIKMGTVEFESQKNLY